MQNENHDDHGGLKKAVDKVTDTVGGMVGMASASTAGSHSANAFVMNAAIGDMYEREAARIAIERSRSPEIQRFAEQMIEDHTTSTHQLRSALAMNETRGVEPPPEEPDQRRQGMLDHLREASDDDFDKMYLDQQQMAHQETITLFRGFAESGDNPQLRSVAAGALPGLERHLEHVKRLKGH